MRKPPTRETQIERDLCERVKVAGGVAFKFRSPNRRNMPDRHCRLPYGVEFYVECKSPGEAPTPAQLKEHYRLRILDARVYITDSYETNAKIVSLEYRSKAQMLAGL